MLSKRVAAALFGLSCCLLTSLSQAQCSKDTDCKGDRVCEGGTCVAPSAPLPPAPAAPDGSTPASAASAPQAAAVPVAAPALPPREEPRDTSVQDTRPRTRRHSTGMLAGGIVMVSFVPIALLAAMVGNIEQDACERGTYSGALVQSNTDCGRFDATIYGGLIGSAVLLGVGIPLIVIGGKKEPLGTARLAPWASPHGAGLGFRVEL